jgi:hypothetical protein
MNGLRGTVTTIQRHVPIARQTIDKAVENFLEYRRRRMPGMIHAEYEKPIDLLRKDLDERGANELSPDEYRYFVNQTQKTFCEVFGPEKLLALENCLKL